MANTPDTTTEDAPTEVSLEFQIEALGAKYPIDLRTLKIREVITLEQAAPDGTNWAEILQLLVANQLPFDVFAVLAAIAYRRVHPTEDLADVIDAIEDQPVSALGLEYLGGNEDAADAPDAKAGPTKQPRASTPKRAASGTQA